MKKHRVFIAISLPQNIKKQLVSYERRWPELPIKWTNPDNLHITLVFLGLCSDDEIFEVCNIVKSAASNNYSFKVVLNRIAYDSSGSKIPRMVWVTGEKSQGLSFLRNDLEKSLMGSNILNVGSENKTFFPHITLGRIRSWEFRRFDLDERPVVDNDILLDFKVDFVDIVESRLRRNGPEYTVLKSYRLKS